MKTFLSFVRKEFYHIFRDARTMLLLLGMPVVQILLFGFALSTEVKNSNVAVLAPSHDDMTRRITERLDASTYFNVTHHVGSIAEIDDLFRRGDIALAVIFSPRFASVAGHSGEAAIQLIADGSEPNQAQMVTNYATQILASALPAGQGIEASTIKVNTRLLYNPQAKSAFNFVPGVMGMILLLVCAMMTSVSIVREKETGTMEVLLASPVRPMTIVLAKAIPYFILSIVNIATILLLAWGALGVPIRGGLPLLLSISGLYILLALSLGLLISSLVRTQMAAVLVSGMVFLLPTMILSGLMFPIESMPTVLQYIAAVIPARWFISAARRVMIEGAGLGQIATEIGVMTSMTAVFLTAGIRGFKQRLS